MAPDAPQKNKSVGDAARAVAVGWMLPFELIVPTLVAGGVGYLLDRWLHTKPIFMLVLGLGGMVVGLWNVIRVANSLDKNSGG